MTYTPNVPQGSQRISTTQPIIQANFGYINTAMQVNHTWNGNAIGLEANGSHQKIAFPNQGADIVALPTGIASVMYSIGGNIFSWNGAKRPVSGVVNSGTITLNPSASIGSVVANCIGFVLVKTNNAITNNCLILAFFAVGGTVYTMQAVQAVGSQTVVSLGASGLALTLTAASNYAVPNIPYKLIYWPV